MSLFEKLDLGNDGPHAFYLGTELMKAEIAWLLGKRYIQDEPLDWGCAADRPAEDLTRLAEAGHTLAADPLDPAPRGARPLPVAGHLRQPREGAVAAGPPLASSR